MQLQPLKYAGAQIVIEGERGDNSIEVFQHMYGDGTSETIGLRKHKAYVVGGPDENGNIIKDWVFETYMLSGTSLGRPKTRVEEELDRHESKGNVITAQTGSTIE